MRTGCFSVLTKFQVLITKSVPRLSRRAMHICHTRVIPGCILVKKTEIRGVFSQHMCMQQLSGCSFRGVLLKDQNLQAYLPQPLTLNGLSFNRHCSVNAMFEQPTPMSSLHEQLNQMLWTTPLLQTTGRLIIVDGTAVLYRAYYRVQARMVYGKLSDIEADKDCSVIVLSALSTIVQFLELKPSHVAVCFDAKGSTFRHELYSEYKKQRPPTPDTIVHSLPVLISALVAMGVKVMREFGVEADDVIGTLAVQADKANMEVCIVSPDKDFFQVVSPRVRLLRLESRGSGITLFGVEEFKQKFRGTVPGQFVDILALMGDQSDNVPGVRGIGVKTAPVLIRDFGTLENLLDNVSSIAAPRVRKAMENGREDALLSKRLVALQTNLPHVTPSNWDVFEFSPKPVHEEMVLNLLDALGIDKLSSQSLKQRLIKLWEP